MATHRTTDERRRRTRISLGLALVALIAVTMLARLGREARGSGEALVAEGATPREREQRREPVELAVAETRAAEPQQTREAVLAEPTGSEDAASEPERALLHVRVLDAAGAPMASGMVEIGREPGFDRDIALNIRGGGSPSVRLEPGGWRIRLRGRNGEPVLHRLRAENARESTLLELRSGEERELVLWLVAGRAVSGRVLDARSEGPLAFAEVFAPELGRAGGVRTDGLGRFLIEDVPLRKGRVELVAIADGYAPAKGGAERTDEIVLRLAPEKALRGVVIAGVDPRTVRVSIMGEVRDAARAAGLEPELDRGGQLRIDGLRSDVSHLLVLEAEGHARFTRSIEPFAGVLDLGALELQQHARLIGRVVWRRGEETPELFVRARPSDLLQGATDERGRIGGWTQVAVDEDGRYALKSLTSGPWTLEVRDRRDTLLREELVLAGGTTERVFDLR